MIDQVAPRVPWPFYNEGDSFGVNVAFLDRAGRELEAPDSVDYRIDDVTTPACPINIRDWTSASIGETDSILVESSDNALQSRCSEYERRQITVRVNRDDTSQVSGRVTWVVRNQGFNP